MRNETETRRGIGIIGAGRLGTSLGLGLEQSGHPIVAVASASAAAAAEFAARLGGARACAVPAEVAERCELIVLAVPDDAIEGLAAALPFAAGQSVVHCSGALGLDALAAARARGAACGCLHPLQSFPERFAPERFAGIACGIEAEGELSARLEALCRALCATPLRLEGVDRARYHAAAVFANNYVIALSSAAARALELAGLSRDVARSALAPLTQAAADNARRLPLEDALTGPLARGDVATLARHLQALEANPELRELYVRLARELLRLPLSLHAEQRAGLEALLQKAL